MKIVNFSCQGVQNTFSETLYSESMTNNVLNPGSKLPALTNLQFSSPPPRQTDSDNTGPASTDPVDSYKPSPPKSKFWKKVGIVAALGLAVAGGASTLIPEPPVELEAGSQEVSVSQEVLVADLKKSEAKGLAAIPSDWVPGGESAAYARSPFGSARGTTTRGTKRITLDLHGNINPDLTITDLGEGRVQAFVDLPGPFDQTSTGTLKREGEELVYQNDTGDTTARVKKQEDGSLTATLNRKGWPEWELLYRGE